MSVEPETRPRQLERRDGFSVLAPDPQKFNDLQRRQQLAQQARPKPQASELQFTEMVNPASADASADERRLARERWIADMQNKADPKQARRRAAVLEQQRREQEQQADRERRAEFERGWHERQAVQAKLTSDLNNRARQKWAGAGAEYAGAQQPPKASRVAGSRSGELAVSAQAARSQQCLAEEQRRELEAKACPARIRQEQDEEFQLSLLKDQLKSLVSEAEGLSQRILVLRKEAEGARLRQQHAEQRLSRYGENPSLRLELDSASQTAERAQNSLDDAEEQLASVTAEAAEKQQLLAAEQHAWT
mmetsp:Transcript_3152/g.7377  ORF Transcript_3152/g.7377 Transcript_3152/m.7377 type:complete len:306 (-) Transcript_3152:226-1143(-)